MVDLKPYFCSECGRTHIYKDFNKTEDNKRCCGGCASTRICLSGWALLMVAATLGLIYVLPNIISYKLGTTTEFKLGLMKGDPYVFLPTILLLALVSVLRIVEMKLKQKKAMLNAQQILNEQRQQSGRPASPEIKDSAPAKKSAKVEEMLQEIEKVPETGQVPEQEPSTI